MVLKILVKKMFTYYSVRMELFLSALPACTVSVFLKRGAFRSDA